MNSKKVLERIVEYEKKSNSKLLKDIQMIGREDLDLNSILQDLERLETLEIENKEYFEIITKQAYLLNNKHIDRPFIEILQQENEKLKKALEKSCKLLNWDCPCSQDLIDDLDCENRCQPDIDYAECWKKYFLKEVLGE